MPGFQSTRLVTEGALEPFFFLYTDDSIQGNPETCKQGSIMLNYEVKNIFTLESSLTGCKNYSVFQFSHFLFFLQCRSENLAHFHLLGTAAVSECVSQRAGRWSWSGRHEMYAMRAYRKLRLRSAPNKISIPALWTLMNRQGIYLAAGMWGAPDFVLLLIALQSELDGFPGKVLFGVSSSDFL